MRKKLINTLLAAAICACVNPVIAQDMATLIAAAKKEGTVNSLGMPNDWANWKDTWEQITKKYGITHMDNDMSSAQEVAKFEAEKTNASGDIGDVGQAFGPIAKKKGLTLAYKPTTWNDIPAWAKDDEGHWAVAYTGTMSFISNNKLVKNPPKNWDDLLKGTYKVSVGEVGVAAQANSALLAVAIAKGGSEKNLEPAYKFFAELAKQGRLANIDPTTALLEKGEVEVGLMWDFNALGKRAIIDQKMFTVSIPLDGSVSAGYATIINKYAKNPNAAKLTREYIFSDAGQVNLARGYARPIRSNVVLPQDAKDKMLPAAEYKNAKPIEDFAAWEATTKTIARQWQEQVMVYKK